MRLSFRPSPPISSRHLRYHAFAISIPAHRHYLASNRWPYHLRAEVRRAVEKLTISGGISIRSSTLREDLEGQRFASQYRTFLKVFSPDVLFIKIEKCWNRTQTELVRSYLQLLETTTMNQMCL